MCHGKEKAEQFLTEVEPAWWFFEEQYLAGGQLHSYGHTSAELDWLQAGVVDVHGRNIEATSSNITSIELGRATAADIRAAFKEHLGTEMPMEVPSGSLSVVVGSDTESVSRRCYFLFASAIVVSSCFSQRCVILQRP